MTLTTYRPLLLLGGIVLAAQAIPPISKHFSVAWSVCRLFVVCRISTPCLNRSAFDRFGCHLAGTPVGPMRHCVRHAWLP